MADDGLRPIGGDGFETGDYRNFAPVYLGDESGWIRPTVEVTDREPIAGSYSLRWAADDQPHAWALVSNAFHLDPPVSISAALRIDGSPAEPYAVGLGLAATPERAAAIRATGSGVELAESTWMDAASTDGTVLDPGEVYTLDIELGTDGSLAGSVSLDGTTVTHLSGRTTVTPRALGLYVETAAGDDVAFTVDDVSVDAAPYRVAADEWTRSPAFVALPRQPDVELDQGNWVGAPAVLDEGDRYRMWYRIRNLGFVNT